MRTQKWLGQGLAPAPKLGLVSCLCVTALSWPMGLLSEAKAQASARRGSAPTHATELPLENPSLSPAADLVFAPQSKASLPAKLGTLNVQDFSPQASFSPLPAEPILKIGEQRQSALQPIATLYSYAMDGRQAVTVYVRDLPIVTFIEHPRLEPPLLRASSLVAQLNQMAQGSLKDTTITLAWTEFQGGDPLYAVQVNDQELLRIDEGVLLVDSQRPVDTALLAANRLRRLLLDAPPLPAPALPQLATLPAKAAAQPPQRTAQQGPLFTVERVQEGIASWYDLHPHSAGDDGSPPYSALRDRGAGNQPEKWPPGSGAHQRSRPLYPRSDHRPLLAGGRSPGHGPRRTCPSAPGSAAAPLE
jgi:rare lipoprotein A